MGSLRVTLATMEAGLSETAAGVSVANKLQTHLDATIAPDTINVPE